MNYRQLKLWSELTFKTISYRKNFDMVVENENILTEYDGDISKLQLAKQMKPLKIGEYGYTLINCKLGRELDYNVNDVIRDYITSIGYSELNKCIENNDFDISKYKKVLLIHTLVVSPKYRKKGIVEEFIEALYRDFYDNGVAIVALVLPFQDNPQDEEYFFNHDYILLDEKIGNEEITSKVLASEYYSLYDFYNKEDKEFNELKLFSVADRCGFKRIGETNIFQFTPEKTIERLLEKVKKINKLNE